MTECDVCCKIMKHMAACCLLNLFSGGGQLPCCEDTPTALCWGSPHGEEWRPPLNSPPCLARHASEDPPTLAEASGGSSLTRATVPEPPARPFSGSDPQKLSEIINVHCLKPLNIGIADN